MDTSFDHVMIRVEDLEESFAWYTENFGYEERSRWEADTFTNVKLGVPGDTEDDVTLELTYNHDGRTYESGDAWGHIAIRTDDVYGANDMLMENGVPDYRDPDSCGGNIAFVKDPDGHQIELVTSSKTPEFSIDHVMTRVEDLDQALGFWQRKFEFVEKGRWEANTFANHFVGPEDASENAMRLELTYNYDGRSYTMGDGWGHLAIATDEEIEPAWETLMEREAEDYRDPPSNNYSYAFTKTPDGHEIEVFGK